MVTAKEIYYLTHIKEVGKKHNGIYMYTNFKKYVISTTIDRFMFCVPNGAYKFCNPELYYEDI